MTRPEVLTIILAALREQLEFSGEPTDGPLTEDTPLMGGDAPIDSLGLVTVIVEVEQRLQDDHGVSVILADERAMSQYYSPFRTAGTLADYALASIDGNLTGD
jgi:acyl carrier protein